MKGGLKRIGAVSVFIIGIILLLIKKETIMGKISRGLRNNNPFNINRTTTQWIGQILGTDIRFASFIDLAHGIRAGLINLYNGYFRHGMTIKEMINKYSPASDNKTKSDPTGEKSVEAYIKRITIMTGINGYEVPHESDWLKVASAMLYHENGVNVKSADELREIAIIYGLSYYL